MAKTKYKVLHMFIDLENGNKVYVEGDSFPRPANKKISDERIEELTTSNNKRGKALIKEVEDK